MLDIAFIEIGDQTVSVSSLEISIKVNQVSRNEWMKSKHTPFD